MSDEKKQTGDQRLDDAQKKKTPYSPPELKKLGTVEEVTGAPGPGITDGVVGTS